MKKSERDKLQEDIRVLEFGNKELRKNLLNVRAETAKCILYSCIELAKGQGRVVYDVDFKEIFSPYGLDVETIMKKAGLEVRE